MIDFIDKHYLNRGFEKYFRYVENNFPGTCFILSITLCTPSKSEVENPDLINYDTEVERPVSPSPGLLIAIHMML